MMPWGRRDPLHIWMGVHPRLAPLGSGGSESRAESHQVPPCWDSGQGEGPETQSHVESQQAHTHCVSASPCLLWPPAPITPLEISLSWLLQGREGQKGSWKVSLRFLARSPLSPSPSSSPNPLVTLMPGTTPSHESAWHFLNHLWWRCACLRKIYV